MKKIKFDHIISVCTFLAVVASLILRLHQQPNIYLQNPPVFQAQSGEWRIGYWPTQARLLSIDQVVQLEKEKNPDITEQDIRKSISMNEIVPPALPIEVKYIDFGISKNYEIKKSEKN